MKYLSRRIHKLRGTQKLTLLCLSLALLGACASQPREFLNMNAIYEGGWIQAYSAESNVERIVEFVQPGETVDNWTELVTIHTFNKRLDWGSIDLFLDTHRMEIGSRCPGSSMDVIRRGSNSLLYESKIVNCPTGPNEQNITRLLDARANRFLITYAVRSPKSMTDEQRSTWIYTLSTISIREL